IGILHCKPHSASTRVYLENGSSFGSFFRVVEIDLVKIANDPRTEPRPTGVRRKDITNELCGFRWPQLNRSHRLFSSFDCDGCVTRRTQVANPIDLTERADQPSSASIFDYGHGCGTRQTTLATLNGEKHIGPHWDTSGKEQLGNRIEVGNPRRNVS